MKSRRGFFNQISGFYGDMTAQFLMKLDEMFQCGDDNRFEQNTKEAIEKEINEDGDKRLKKELYKCELSS